MLKTKNKSNVITETIDGEKYTPYTLFKKLGGIGLLESASFGRGKGRFSIILLDEAFSVVHASDSIILIKEGKKFRINPGHRDILEVCRAISKQHMDKNYYFPFPAGGIGYISYEYVKHFEDIKFRAKSSRINIPDAWFIFGHSFIIFDHYTDSITIVLVNYHEHNINLERRLEEIKRKINDLDFNYLKQEDSNYITMPLNLNDEFDAFINGVKKVKREIIKGNLLQGVLSRKLYVHTNLPALEAYRRLRSLNPSPYMFYLNFKYFQIFGSSPEVHVKVKGNKVIMRPIAGTRKRGNNEKEDKLLEKELLNDPKELAEHLMLVDLVRNDLGRICVPGSVEVTDFQAIERYSHVMHIVSQVEGTLREGVPSIEAIRKTFPAGTVSGAPKISAIKIIDSLERENRGFYAGIVGYMEPGGDLDTCITIRSALKSDDLLLLQAGAGIVYDSVPEREYEETSSKLRALGKSIGIEV